ncbi:MAG: TonB-dependent siderophore receptor, partial [Gammaproteobacteria bacterium]|nr:TonB-dependent siderophore receptor [Gammaproteobacteria bacterium]
MNNASAVVKWAGCGAALILAGAPLAIAKEAAVLDSITITADQERADGPVQGYRAKRTRSATKTDTPIEEIPQSISVVPASVLQDLDSPRVEKALDFAGGVAR